MHAFKVNESCNLSRPQIVGYMSVNISRQYRTDLSQLKFLNYVPDGKICMDLNYKIYEAVKRTTDENNEQISLLLQFLINNMQHIKLYMKDLTFITYRRTLISVMYNSFNNEHVRIMASYFNGCIYLCSLETPQEIQRRQTRSDKEKQFCAWGYKFEQYILSGKLFLIYIIFLSYMRGYLYVTLVSLCIADQNLLFRAPVCFRRHVKPLVPAAFAVVSTYLPALDTRGGLWPVLLMCNP
jgi:hypothetical protein